MDSSPTILNLRPSHHLLNPNFDGYKLSLEPIPILKNPLIASPRRAFTNEDQYTFLHAKLFSLHNHLWRDPWLSYSSYFIDETWTIQNVRYDPNTGALPLIKSVFKITKPNVGHDSYNPSFSFVSEKYCVFSDGCGALRILDTNDRYRNDEWKCIFSEILFDRSIPFLIQNARLEIINGVRQINCLLLSIQERITGNDDKKFETVIDWIRLVKETDLNVWNQMHVKQLRGKSLPEYCSFETKCNAILLSTDSKFQFIFDTEHPIEHNDISDTIESKNVVSENDVNLVNFSWTQTDEDVIIHFKIERDCNKNDIKIVSTGSKVHVYHQQETLLDAELYEKIDNDLTTWNLENELLQVTLAKLEANIVWKSLLKDTEIHPVEHPIQSVRDLSQPPTSTLRTEMEDCDYGDCDIESEFTLVRIDTATHKITHKTNLGPNNPILFSLPIRAGHPSAFALRNDVDVCLWLVHTQTSIATNEIDNYTVQIRHEGTLNAFGYIQASKQQKKYIQCSPDMNYSLICEPHRHIFIYKGAYESATGLKNRNSATKVSIGQQKLITMDESDEVLGIICENEVTILLTQQHILCLQINS